MISRMRVVFLILLSLLMWQPSLAQDGGEAATDAEAPAAQEVVDTESTGQALAEATLTAKNFGLRVFWAVVVVIVAAQLAFLGVGLGEALQAGKCQFALQPPLRVLQPEESRLQRGEEIPLPGPRLVQHVTLAVTARDVRQDQAANVGLQGELCGLGGGQVQVIEGDPADIEVTLTAGDHIATGTGAQASATPRRSRCARTSDSGTSRRAARYRSANPSRLARASRS